MNDYTIKAIVLGLESCVELEWITFNPLVTHEAVARQIRDEIEKSDKERKTNEEIAKYFELKQKYEGKV